MAEKCEAMVKLGMANSRMKDFHDLSSLAALFSFDGVILAHAIAETFARRKTEVPVGRPTALTADSMTMPRSAANGWLSSNATACI